MTCEICDAEKDQAAAFCDQRGNVLTSDDAVPLDCPSCGATNVGSAKFCASCGSSLAPPESLDFSHFPKPPPVPRGANRGSLLDRFTRLGALQGRTRDEIEAVVGLPYAIEVFPPDGLLIKWSQTRMTWKSFADTFHIELAFDANGICGGVMNEYRRAL